VGQVNFCDASVNYCSDIHLLAKAQLIQTGPRAGTAVFRFIPGIGSHSYKAVFMGTPQGRRALCRQYLRPGEPDGHRYSSNIHGDRRHWQ
jgi:hypothetical protein